MSVRLTTTPHWITMQAAMVGDRGQFWSLSGSKLSTIMVRRPPVRNTQSLYADRCINMHKAQRRYSADEHARTSESPNMATATPSARRGPDAAEAARRVARAGRAAIRRQHPSALRARRGRSPSRSGELTSRTPTRHRAPNQQPGRILIPGDGAAGDQGLRIGLPARRWRLCDACGLSRLNDFPALWFQAYMPSCNRRVTSTSTHMAKPGPASAPALTHRNNRTHCL